MEKYQDFLRRIGEFELPDMDLGKNYFKGRPSLADKIDGDNRMRDFFGDTIVFELTDEEKRIVGSIIDKVYEEAPNCFAERLNNATLHMTLHDLSNSPRLSDVEEEMEKNKKSITDNAWRLSHTTIRMKSKFVFNMVNTSLVLGLVPVNEEEFAKLMGLWGVIDEIKESPYPPTPHITLGYYNVHGFAHEDAKKLEKIVGRINRQDPIYVNLDTERLFYQRFTGMNHYENALCLNGK